MGLPGEPWPQKFFPILPELWNLRDTFVFWGVDFPIFLQEHLEVSNLGTTLPKVCASISSLQVILLNVNPIHKMCAITGSCPLLFSTGFSKKKKMMWWGLELSIPQLMGGNSALDTHPRRFLKKEVPHTTSCPMIYWGEREGDWCVSFRVLIPDYSHVPWANTPRHSASLCQQQSFLLIHHMFTDYAVDTNEWERLGFNQHSIQSTMPPSIHSLTRSLL